MPLQFIFYLRIVFVLASKLKRGKYSRLCMFFFWVIQTPGNYPEENIQNTEHGKSLKSRIVDFIESGDEGCMYIKPIFPLFVI